MLEDLEYNRRLVVEIREGRRDCSDEFLRRSLSEERLQDIVSVLSQPNRGPLWPHVDLNGLLDNIRDFHKRAGTCTPKVSANINRIADQSVPLIRFAHTPDFLPYTGVLSNLALCEAMSSITCPRAVPIALMVDVDTVEDARMRRALIPCSVAELLIDIPKKLRRRVAGILPPPGNEQGNKILDRLRSLSETNPVSSGITKLCGHVAFALDNARNYGEFSSIVWSRLLNLDAGLGTVFVNQIASAPFLSSAWNSLGAYESEFAIANKRACSSLKDLGFSPDVRVFSKLRFWSVCLDCGRREIAGENVSRECKCGSYKSISVPTLSSDVLSDWMIWGFSAGTSYPGSSSHVLVSLKIAEAMGFKNWTEVLWSGNSIVRGEMVEKITHFDADQGRVSIVADLSSESMDYWSKSWQRHLIGAGLSRHLASRK